MRKIKVLTGLFIVILLLAFFGVFRQKYVAPILMYHSVSPDENASPRLRVSPDTFRRQMRFLKKNHYRVVRLQDLARLIRENEDPRDKPRGSREPSTEPVRMRSGLGFKYDPTVERPWFIRILKGEGLWPRTHKRPPYKTVAITFDDGYRGNYTYAFDVLKEYGFPFTVFVIVDEIGRPERLSWSQLRQMRDSGLADIGSHCLGPQPLVDIDDPVEVKRQIYESKAALERELDMPVNTFSYPEGRFNQQIRQLVSQAGYLAAVTTSPGRKYSNRDIFALKRLRISETSRNMAVFWIQTSGLYTFIKEVRDSD